VILSSLNNVSRGEKRGGVGHNWEKYFIGLFHVSEHLGHFKAITKKLGKKGNKFVKRPNYFRFFLVKASLKNCGVMIKENGYIGDNIIFFYVKVDMFLVTKLYSISTFTFSFLKIFIHFQKICIIS
jgi:hypothetical protein